ncbi:MAG: tetratricopeptide repeat protein [Blastocatellia bacterium]
MKRYSPFFLCMLLIVALGASSSDKELIIRLQGEVLVLQKQVRDLQESFDKSTGQSVTLMQKVTDNSETTLRSLSAIEEAIKLSQTTQSNSFTGATTRINRLSEQANVADKRLDQIASQINSLKNLIEQQAKQRQEDERKRETAPPRFENPEQLYAYAYTQYTQGKYDEAITNFRRYVEAYGSTEAADNAQFWVGEGLFAQMRYAEALADYDRLLTTYPNGDKVLAARFKKGLALLYLERREEGVAELRTVIRTAPNSPEASQARQELERLGESPNAPVTPTTTKPRSRPN